ncbi:MAG TPA: ArsA-related P-loop ATPase [Polyangiaceae bacterium]|jgi:anion-transporting  ArsA/GET3 family ATPase|nr:ArsA-related P-loop ATPase [Polyangiaceae bacterium]
MTESLEQILTSRRIVVAVGAGGVGKTTTAAALGVAAAAHGRRVLCLTVDPARRLAQALGLERMSSEEQVIDPARFAATGLPLRGSLSAMMLDTKRTFDELVLKYSSTPERAKKLLGNKLYQYVSTSLAGTQEYMAMEKLVAVDREGRFDLIVLDTPPTANALDFLDAPDRLVEALDSQTMRWFIQAFESTGKVSLNLLARSASVILRGLGRITGGGFLESMAEFITELNDLFGGFRQRAQEVEGVLRGPGVTFVLVTSPAPMSIQEVLFFNDRLEQAKLARGAFVVNRFRLPPQTGQTGAAAPTEAVASAAAALRGLPLTNGEPARLVRAYGDAVRLAALDDLHVRSLTRAVSTNVPVVRVPELAGDVHDLAALGNVVRVLMAGGV